VTHFDEPSSGPAWGLVALRPLPAPGRVLALAWSADGRLAIGLDNAVARVLDPDSGREVARLATGWRCVWALAWSPDGRTLATGTSDWAVRLWHAIGCFETRRLDGHGAAVRAVAWSPGEHFLASADQGGTVICWSVREAFKPQTLAQGPGPAALAITWLSAPTASGSRTLLAVGFEDGTVRLWDPAAPGRRPGVLVTAAARLRALASDGTRLAAAVPDAVANVTPKRPLPPVPQTVHICETDPQRRACSQFRWSRLTSFRFGSPPAMASRRDQPRSAPHQRPQARLRQWQRVVCCEQTRSLWWRCNLRHPRTPETARYLRLRRPFGSAATTREVPS
jgi:hypothetical protein